MLHLQGHQGAVNALAFAPNGQTLISAGGDGTVRLWDVAAGREKARLTAHAGPVLSLAIHPNGVALASGGADGSLNFWSLATGQLVRSEPKQMAAVTGLAWLAGRTSLLVACGERLRPDRAGELRLWNLDGPKPARSVCLEAQGLWSLTAARHSTTVAWGGGARAVNAWDITHQEPRLFRQSSGALAVCLSDDGLTLASTLDRAVKVWDVESGLERVTFEGHRGMVRALTFAPCGKLLASGGQDQTVRLWRLDRGAEAAGPVYQWPIGAVHSLTFAPDGMTAAAGGHQGSVWVWDVDE